VRGKIGQERQQIAVAASDVDVIFIQKGVADLGNGRRLLQKLPDSRTGVVEAVIDTVLQIEHHQRVVKLGREHIASRDNRRRIGDVHGGLEDYTAAR
jgi:hypothetical protein